jgi:hypothetical protein
MSDPISPDHYQFDGIQVIDLTEQMNFNRGNVIKYVARAGRKDPQREIEDLKKARFYLTRELGRLTSNGS